MNVTKSQVPNQMIFRLLVWAIALLFCVPSYGQSGLQNQIDMALKGDFYKYAQVGISVRNLKTNALLLEVNKDKLMIPGSTLKIITTISAQEILGETYRFETKVSYDGFITSDGTLKGNIYIEGQGDPTLGSERIQGNLGLKALTQKLVSEIRAKGIQCVEGDIISINPEKNLIPIQDTWQWHDLGNYYATGSWPININENLYNIYYNRSFNLNQKAKISYIEPYVPNLQLSSEVTVASAETQDNAYILGPAFQYEKKITGTIPQGKTLYKVKGAIPDPPLFLAFLVYQSLGQGNISGSTYRTEPMIPISTKNVVIHKSPPLSEIIKYTNFNSINLYADALLRSLKPNNSPFGNIDVLKFKLFQSGADTMAMDIKDGCGLSARNLLTPDQMSNFIVHHSKNNGADALKKILPVAGKEGTVTQLLKNTNAQGKMWLKSGSMNRILCYAGIAEGKSGDLYALTIFLNGSTSKENKVNRTEIEKLLLLIYNQS
jgi:serine-type D-Ala-D-Ala carboxypeptidase/endopeptidase (penicillin-binding protein 4)